MLYYALANEKITTLAPDVCLQYICYYLSVVY